MYGCSQRFNYNVTSRSEFNLWIQQFEYPTGQSGDNLSNQIALKNGLIIVRLESFQQPSILEQYCIV